jgi:glutamine synthetase
MAAKLSVIPDIDVTMEETELKELSDAQSKLYRMSVDLEKKLKSIPTENAHDIAVYFRDIILSLMQEIREVIDFCEENVSSEFWPLPTYTDIIFRV